MTSTSKRCYSCKNVKLVTDFYRNRSRPDGLRAECKTCSKEKFDIYKTNNPEYFKNHWQKYYAEHRPQLKANLLRWQKQNRERVSFHNRRRKYFVKNAVGDFTLDDLKRMAVEQKNRCFYCNDLCRLTVDHKTPLSRGGSNYPSNLVLACVSCNCSKKAKTAEEFVGV